MERLEYIDDYFKGEAIAGNEADFEERLLTDKDFTEDVAFYLSTIQVARTFNEENKKSRFKEIYYQNNSQKSVHNIKKLWPYAAMLAALLATLFAGIYLYNQPESSTKLVNAYFAKELQTLGVLMGNSDELLQQGNRLYNDGRYRESLKKFEELLQKDTSNSDAKENAGIVSLKLNNFDQALVYFRQVESKGAQLNDNTGKFYQALTLMKRNLPGDKAIYKKLLQEVVSDNLYGKEDAQKFLNRLK